MAWPWHHLKLMSGHFKHAFVLSVTFYFLIFNTTLELHTWAGFNISENTTHSGGRGEQLIGMEKAIFKFPSSCRPMYKSCTEQTNFNLYEEHFIKHKKMHGKI